MGTIHKIQKNLTPGVVLDKTGLFYGGSELCLLGGDSEKASAFRARCLYNEYRSGRPSVDDILSLSVVFRERILSGKAIWN